MSLLTGTFGDDLEIDNVLSNTRYEDVAVWAPSEPSDEGRNILWHIRPEDWRWEGRGWGVAAMRRGRSDLGYEQSVYHGGRDDYDACIPTAPKAGTSHNYLRKFK